MRTLTHVSKEKSVENPKGITRTTLTYNKDIMLCHFKLDKGAEIPRHNHPAVQIGYVVKGKVLFTRNDEEFLAEPGISYLFQSQEYHSAKVLEDAELVECFTPTREEYIN